MITSPWVMVSRYLRMVPSLSTLQTIRVSSVGWVAEVGGSDVLGPVIGGRFNFFWAGIFLTLCVCGLVRCRLFPCAPRGSLWALPRLVLGRVFGSRSGSFGWLGRVLSGGVLLAPCCPVPSQARFLPACGHWGSCPVAGGFCRGLWSFGLRSGSRSGRPWAHIFLCAGIRASMGMGSCAGGFLSAPWQGCLAPLSPWGLPCWVRWPTLP